MDYEHKEITEKIIRCCYNVYNKMGFGYLESVYEKCLLIELEKAGLMFEDQKPINVNYDGRPVGLLINFGEEKVQVKRKIKNLKDLNNNPENPVILSKK